MNLRNFWKKIKKPFMTVAAVILVLLLFVVSVTQNQAAPENPMEKECRPIPYVCDLLQSGHG